MLRPATPADLDAIMALEHASFPTDAWSADTMASELTSPHNVYLVDEHDGAVIGYGGVRALQGGADADIQTIALDPGHRGQGRGRALLRALIAEGKTRGARELFLEVRADNPAAEGLYLSEGFTELGRRPRYYQPDDVDAIVMRLDLRSWASAPHVPQGITRNAGSEPEADPAERVISGAAGATTPATTPGGAENPHEEQA